MLRKKLAGMVGVLVSRLIIFVVACSVDHEDSLFVMILLRAEAQSVVIVEMVILHS